MGVTAPARHHHSKQERREIAEESLQPGASMAVVTRGHGVNANQVFHGRKLLREGRLVVNPIPAQLMPVRITEVIEDKSRSSHQFGSNSAGCEFGLRARPILQRSEPFWSNWAGDLAAVEHECLDRRAAAKTALEQNPYSGPVFVFRANAAIW